MPLKDLEKRRVYSAKWYVEHRDAILAQQAKYRATNPEKHLPATVKYRKNLRNDVITHYGGRCVCCGEDREVFLALDHIDGGGRAHRKEVGTGHNFYLWVKKNGYSSDLQVLCHNCNWAKRMGVCPHQQERLQG
jgi:RNase P subunit RPR2